MRAILARTIGVAWLAASVGCKDPSTAPHIAAPLSSTGVALERLNAAVGYAAADLGVLPGGHFSVALAINSNGDVVGYGDSPTGVHPILWIGNSAQDLGAPSGIDARAVGVNASRTVVGSWHDVNTNAYKGFVWKSGTYTILSSPPPSGMDEWVSPAGVNRAGEVVGDYTTPTGGRHAFRYNSAGGIVDIHPSGYSYSVARSLNDQGVAVGFVAPFGGTEHVAMWSATNVFTDLGVPAAWTSAQANAVNNGGVVVGRTNDSGSQMQPFVWRNTTGFVVAVPPVWPTGISDRGRAVGNTILAPLLAITQKGKGQFEVLPLPPGFLQTFVGGVNRCGTAAGSANSPGLDHAVRWTIAACDP